MRPCLHLALILCIALTSIGLGVARGTVAVGGQMVLCTGVGIVVVADPDAPDSGVTHICPDMALALMAAVASAPPLPSRDTGASDLSAAPHVTRLVLFRSPPTSARDPPSVSVI